MSTENLCRSFPFAASPAAEILILGSMPGARSLAEQQYYAHPQNIFWEIMGEVCGASRERPYAERLRILQARRVALWDVVSQCRRAGSLDGNIRRKSVVPNDFNALFARCPRIHSVFFNGQAAAQFFQRLVVKDLAPDCRQRLRLIRLPSTSPAHAGMPTAEKKAAWRRAIASVLVMAPKERHLYENSVQKT